MNPGRRRKPLGSAQEWMDHAESDMRLAQLAAGDPSIRAEQICFHAQQAAEKAIKAVALFRRIEFPFTHDIETILGLVEESGEWFPEAVREAGSLTPYASETRYPGSWMDISHSEVIDALHIATLTIEWARGVITGGK